MATNTPHVIISTRLGEIEIELLPGKAPGHVENFLKLAGRACTTRRSSIASFRIHDQGGDPSTKDPGAARRHAPAARFTIRAEFNDTHHARGVVSMARANDPDSPAASSSSASQIRDSSTASTQLSGASCAAWKRRTPS